MLIYAIDSDSRIVHIDEVKTGQECSCICPACKEPLIAKNKGKVRVHHFAHKSGVECEFAYESMLHILAKERIQEAFLKAELFWFDFEYRSYCLHDNCCKYVRYDENCYSIERRRFNLREYYDSCKQEVSYDGIKRRSDLKLYSSTHPDRKPIYIEFCVTHASEQEKLHSGNKIIECLIEGEEDIAAIIENGFVEDKQTANEYDKSLKAKIQIYGFKNTDNINVLLNREIEFSRYVLYRSGKVRCFRDGCKCKDLKKLDRNSLYEACFHTYYSFGIHEFAKYLGYSKYHIPNCVLCKNYVDNYNGSGKICKNYKYLQISQYKYFDTSRAKTCCCFTFNQEEYEQELQSVGIPYDEL